MKWRTFFLMCITVASVVMADAPRVFRRSLDRVASLDPVAASSAYAARAIGLVYETLLEVDYVARPYRLIPGVAEAMPEISADGRVLTFQIRANARFIPDACFGLDATGMPRSRAVTAADVVYSLKRLADRKYASSGAWLVEDIVLGMRAFAEASANAQPTDYSMDVAGLTVLDERRVQITLTRPVYQFCWFLTMAYTAIVPHEAVARYGADFGSHPVGSGAYTLAAWRRNHQMTYRRNRAWHGWAAMKDLQMPDAPQPFDEVQYRVVDDVSTQWLSFLAGELDFLGTVSRDNWSAVIRPDGTLDAALEARGVTLYAVPTMDVGYLGINMDDPVLGPNRKLRQALNCAFDAEAWVAFQNGRVTAASGPVPPGTAGRLDTPFPYAFNLDKARRLLAEAGYPDGIDPATGRRLELTVDCGRTTQDARETMELLVAFYAKVGIALKPHYYNWPSFLKRVANRQSQMFQIAWVGDYPDAENFLQLFYGKNISPGPNRVNYINSTFDALYDAANLEPDEIKRNVLWRRAQEIIREDCPWVFLHHSKDYSLTHPSILNYIPSDFPYGIEKYLRAAQRKD